MIYLVVLHGRNLELGVDGLVLLDVHLGDLLDDPAHTLLRLRDTQCGLLDLLGGLLLLALAHLGSPEMALLLTLVACLSFRWA